MSSLEHQIQQAIMKALTYKGVYCWRNNSGVVPVNTEYTDRFGRIKTYKRIIKMGQAGLPDIMGVQKGTGRLVAIEVKQPGKKPTELQVQRMNKLKEYGAIVGVATSIDEAIAIIE